MSTWKGLKVTRIKPCSNAYKEINRIQGDMNKYWVNPKEAEKIIKMIMLRVNNQRKRKGYKIIKVPRLKFNDRGNPYCSWSDYIKLNKSNSIGTVVHELAHYLHMWGALSWKIPMEERGTNIFDCHGTRFIQYVQWQKEIVLKTKSFQKFMV